MSTEDQNSPADPYADLANAVLRAAREIALRGYRNPEAIALTPSNINVIRYIEQHPGASPSEVAEGSGLRRSNLSTALRELEKLGFVKRSLDPRDGRAIRLHATPRVAQNLARVRAEWSQCIDEGLGPSVDVSEALRLLTRLNEGLATARQQARSAAKAAKPSTSAPS